MSLQAMQAATTRAVLGLGIDAGGTATRWALASASGAVLASGEVAGLTALLALSEQGRAQMQAEFASIRSAFAPVVEGQNTGSSTPVRVWVGLTGMAQADPMLRGLIAHALQVDPVGVTLLSDMALTHRVHFAPGAGHVVYAGTGSYGSYVDEQGELHRIGGRGGLLDDGGSGYWIARAALQAVWRAQDGPAIERDSPLAQAVFAHMGGSDWSLTREFVYGQGNAQSRGRMGLLARAVAGVADQDAAALAILQAAGFELARLGQVLLARFGPRPMVLAGRVLQLHPAIESSARAHLTTHATPPTTLVSSTINVQDVAARMAALAELAAPAAH